MTSRSRLDFYMERCGTLTLQEAKYKRTVMYEEIRGDKFIRHIYNEWIDEFGEPQSFWIQGVTWEPLPDHEPIVNYAVSYDPAAVEDLTRRIKLFTSERAADNYIYRCDNNENDDCNHNNNP